MLELSIVTTLYRSEAFIEEFYTRIKNCAKEITSNFEIIFVDDGSDDQSLNIAKKIAETDPKVSVIELSKNFGHHRAMMSGLGFASGELVFLIDSDLEEEPEYLIHFFRKLKESEVDVVFGIQENRKGGWFEKITGWLYYKIVKHFCEIQIPQNLTTVRLMKKKYVSSLLLHNEYIFNIAFLWAMTGYKQIPFTIQKHSKGSSQYTFRKKLALLNDTIISFSNKPLVYMFKLGFFVSLLSFLFIIYMVIKKLLYHSLLSGWTSLIVSIWFFGGLILFSIGLVGIYLRKILLEVKNRPNAIIRNIHRDLPTKVNS